MYFFFCSSQSTSTASGISTYASSLRRTATTNSSEFLCHRETFCLTPEGEEEELDNNNEIINGREHQTEGCYSAQQLEINHNTPVDCATGGVVSTTNSVPEYSLTPHHCLPNQQLFLQTIKVEPQDVSADEREYALNPHIATAYSYASATALQKAETENHFPLRCDQLQLAVQRPLDATESTSPAQPPPPAKVKKSHHKKKKSQKKQKKKSREHRRRHKHVTSASGNNSCSIDASNTDQVGAIAKDIKEVVAAEITPKPSSSSSSNSSSNSNTNSQSSNSNKKSPKTRSSHNSKNPQTRPHAQSHSNGQHASNNVVTHTPSLSPEDKENFCRQFTGDATAAAELHELVASTGAVDALGDTTGAIGTGTQHIATAIVKKEAGVGIVHDMAPTSNMKLPGRQTNNSLSSLTGNIFIPPTLREDATTVASSERAESKSKPSSGSGNSTGHKKHHRHSGSASGSNASSDASVTAEKSHSNGGGGHKKKVAAAAAAATAAAAALAAATPTPTTAVSAKSSSQSSDKSADE